MFKHIANLFGRGEGAQRQIFRFHDGTKLRGVDPMVVLRTLQAEKEFTEADIALAMQGDVDASQRTIRAVRKAFGVIAWEQDQHTGAERGLTEGETLTLLDEFGVWLDAVKKNTNPSLTSLRAMEEESEKTTTSDGSDAGSTSDAPTSGSPSAS